MYNVWKENVKLPNKSDLELLKSERITIKPFEPNKDGYVFLHGVALAMFKGRMYCAWAHNKIRENSEDEEVNYSISDDNGRTWSKYILGNFASENGGAVSHGAFLVHDDALYFFAPQFKGQLGKEMIKMNAYVFDEANEKFHYLGVALDERFWPMCEPILMENGNYIMAGIYVGSDYNAPENTAAVAISHGSDLMHWDMVKLEYAEGVKVWGECSVIANGSHIALYCREHSKKFKALYSQSTDYGKSWSKLDLSNLPMIESKPYAGTLSNGRRYLICSMAEDITSRNPLTIAITEPHDDKFCKLLCIDSGIEQSALSYPYAIEWDNKLYVAYSFSTEGYNRNSAELAIIDLDDLKV